MYIYHYSNTDINGNQGIFFPQGVKSEFCGSDWVVVTEKLTQMAPYVLKVANKTPLYLVLQ